MLGVSAFALLLSAPAQTYGFSVFIDPMLDQLGLSRSLTSVVYTVATLVSAGAVLVVGNVIDRRGHRAVMIVTALVYTVALLVMGSVAGPIGLLVGFTLLRATGASVLTLTSRTLVSQWFVRRRGRAVSFINLGKALGMAVVPTGNALLIQQVGWRDAWRLNAVVVALLVPLAIFVVRNRPEEVDQFPDGRLADDIDDRSASPAPVDVPSWRLNQALRTRAMWLLLAATFVPAMITNGLSFNQISILTEAGLTPTAAATTFAVESFVALPTTLLAGWLCDRFNPRFVLAIGQAALALSLLILVFTDSPGMAILFGAMRGVTTGMWILGSEVAWPAFFGRQYLGSILGLSFAAGFVGAAIGPLPFGVVYDRTGSYQAAIVAMLVLPTVTFFAPLLAVPPTRRRRAAAS